LFIVHFAIGQSYRIIKPWTGSTRAAQSSRQMAGRATSVSAIFPRTPTATQESCAEAKTGATPDVHRQKSAG